MSAPGHDHPRIVVLDFGSQVSQLIARRLREVNVFSEMRPFTAWREVLDDPLVAGIVLSGGPSSVLDPGAPDVDEALFHAGKPLLGICYGMQLMCQKLGGRLAPAHGREYGHAEVEIVRAGLLFAGLPTMQPVWMSHGDHVERLPPGFEVQARTESIPFAAAADPSRNLYAVQFHPEVAHTAHGLAMIEAFARKVCRVEDQWTAAAFVEEAVQEIREQVGRQRVLCAVSGGVDSTVMASLVDRAIGDRLHAVYVDNGVMRDGESDQVERDLNAFLHQPLQRVDARKLFLDRLAGVSEPEQKRKIIGGTFIDVFKDATADQGPFGFLAQGTLYPDRIESVSIHGPSATIKSHHNVGGLPAELGFDLVEPLRNLFKDEVRKVGRELGIPAHLLKRHPFPGPGLAVRILGEVTPERVSLLQAADRIFIDELKSSPAVRRHLAGRRHLPARALGGRDGRRAHLRERRGPARGHQPGRHDGRLGAHPHGDPGAHLQPDHQRGAGHQPCGLRHQQQAAAHHRAPRPLAPRPPPPPPPRSPNRRPSSFSLLSAAMPWRPPSPEALGPRDGPPAGARGSLRRALASLHRRVHPPRRSGTLQPHGQRLAGHRCGRGSGPARRLLALALGWAISTHADRGRRGPSRACAIRPESGLLVERRAARPPGRRRPTTPACPPSGC